MATTPNITLTATLDDMTGAAAGSLANPAKLRITLCGFGPVLPVIAGTAMLARTGPFSVYSTGAAISTPLWGNDQIIPNGTFYSIEILDGEDNVVQCGSYIFTGSGTLDLSDAVQIVPPYGFSLGALRTMACSNVVPGTIFQAPGQVVSVYYNGVLLRPTIDYTLSGAGTIVNLTFTIEPGDNIYALCVSNGGSMSGGASAPAIPGTAISSGILDNFAAQPWQSTHDAGTPGTSTGTSTYISPSVGRNFNFSYTGNGGQRYSLFFATDTTSQNFCFDLLIAFDDPTQILNMELDMNQVLGDGRTVIFDCQCAHVSQTWEYDAWNPSTIYGDPQTWGIGVYHHVRIFWHRDITGNVTTWDGVEFDGVYFPFLVPTANTAQSLGWAVGRLVCNFQIDGASSGSGTVSAYGKNMIVWRW